MATTSYADIYAGEGSAAVSVPEGVYDVRVSDARVGKAESRTLFLDLEILNGPAQGKVAQVNLYVPDVSNRGAVFHYQKKTAGFRSPEFYAAMQSLGQDATLDELLTTIAQFLIGRSAVAELSLQKGGQYDGQNQLDKTSTLGTPVGAAVSDAAGAGPGDTTPRPQPAADPQPAAAAPQKEDDPF